MLDNYQDLIDELLGTPGTVRAAMAAAAGPVSPVVLLMRERDRIVLERLQQIKHKTDPHLKAIPDLDPASLAPVDPDELLSTFETARGDLISLLMNLTLRDWERTATTDNAGVITLADEVEFHVEFDEDQRAKLDALTS